MKTSYPWQVNSIIHKTKAYTKTLGMDAMLYSPKEEDELRTPAAPLEMHEGYSVFKGTLIVKGADDSKDSDESKKSKDSKDSKKTTVLKFNIPAKAVPYIHKKTTMAINMNFFSAFALKLVAKVTRMIQKAFKTGEAAKEKSKDSPAYTVRFMTGTLKGKTPAQLLLESTENRKVLEKQKDFLSANVVKYPGNKKQIEAIEDAIRLYDAGELTGEKETDEPMTSLGVVKIYECAPKNIKPIVDGKYTIYQVSITYDPSMTLPFRVVVMNCLAPVDKTKGNEIKLSEAEDKVEMDMRLSEEEWFTMIDTMKATKIMFENLTYPEQLKLANKLSRESYEASKSV